MENTHLNYAILKYLKELADSKNDAQLHTGISYLSNGLNLFINPENDQKYSTSLSLTSLYSQHQTPNTNTQTSDQDKKFEEYLKILQSKKYFDGTEPGTPQYNDRLNKAREKFFASASNTSRNSPQSSERSPEDTKKIAEDLKNKGNSEFKSGDFNAAIQSYTEAIELYQNAVYYCNRAIAYNKLNKQEEAIADYKKCIEIDPKYVKAYDRLGYTYLNLNNLHEAIEIFQKGLEVDPLNGDLQKHYQQAQQLIGDDMGGMGGGVGVGVGAQGGGAPPPNLGGLPGMGNMNVNELLNNPNLMGGLGNMLNNPEFMQMTMNMMNDPNFQNSVQNMMQNPQCQNMFGGMNQ